jgi:class 3 adenylate cyclase/tetratricopeptide (TPR) repeat protein
MVDASLPSRNPGTPAIPAEPGEVARWLAEIGLGAYAARFAEHHIGPDALLGLTDADLLAIGVSALGDRKRFAMAVTAERRRRDATNAAVPELRQLTVAFFDLVGSTRFAATLDPEDYRTLLRDFQQSVFDAVSRFGGHVAQLLGDGALVYFGHPRAHEDDAIRALHAACAVRDAVAQPRPGNPNRSAVRIGVATGQVVLAGEGVGGQSLPATGETPILAARLQAATAPGEILIATATYSLVEGHFVLEPAGMLQLKGFERPVETWRVAGRATRLTRFRQSRTANLGSLVGRDREVQALRDAVERGAARSGRGVIVSGEAGIGKSRLVEALVTAVDQVRIAPIVWQTSPFDVNSPLEPVAAWLAAGGDAFRAALRRPAGATDAYARTAEWLDARASGRPTSLLPHERSALLDSLALLPWEMARGRMPLIVIEDAHWIDPTTDELLGRIERRMRVHGGSLVVTSRPGYDSEWSSSTGTTRLSLERLGVESSIALVKGLSGAARLGDEAIEEIVARADGIPLYLEELTRSTAGDSDATAARATRVPSSLQDALRAQLDRVVPAARRIVQCAAVMGREFTPSPIARVLDCPLDDVHAAIDELVDSGVVLAPHEAGAPFVFKHALLREATYDGLLRGQRTALHAKIAQTQVRDHAELVARRPELIAYHLEAAGDAARACDAWLRAGDIAARGAAPREAAAHYRAALRLAGGDAESRSAQALELKLLMRLGNALAQTEGFGSPAMTRCYGRARELARTLGDVESFIAACAAVGGTLIANGRCLQVAPLFDDLAAAVPAAPSLRSRVTRDAIIGIARVMSGDLAAARPLLEAAHAGLREELAGGTLTPGMAFRAVNLLGYRAFAALWSGHFGEATALVQEATACAQAGAPGATLAYALNTHAGVMLSLGRLEETRSLAQRARDIAEAQRLRPWALLARFRLVLLDILAGDVGAGVVEVRDLIHGWRSEQGAFHCVEFAATTASALLSVGAPLEAESFVRDGERLLPLLDERIFEAELLRVRGLLLQHAGDSEGARRRFEQALGVAHRQQTGLYEMRAAVDLARLHVACGRPQAALEVLRQRVAESPLPEDACEQREALALLRTAAAAC